MKELAAKVLGIKEEIPIPDNCEVWDDKGNVINTSKIIIREKKEKEVFYFLRKPDNMIECSTNLPSQAKIDIIKMTHTTFKTREDAEKIQTILGVKPLEERIMLNRDFNRAGLAETLGYK